MTSSNKRDGVFGAAADPTLLARLDLKVGDKVSVGEATFQIRSAVEAEPDKLGVGVGFGPRFLISEDALRATGLLQPGSLVRWNYRLKLPENAADDRADGGADRRFAQGGARSRLGSPQPRQRLARSRAHHQSLHAIPHARRARRAAGRRRRRRQCREKPYRSQARRDRRVQGARRHRPRRVRDLSDAGHAARRRRLGDRARRRRGAAVRHRRPVRKIAAAAGGAGRASRRTRALLRLRPAHRTRLRPLAARPRP